MTLKHPRIRKFMTQIEMIIITLNFKFSGVRVLLVVSITRPPAMENSGASTFVRKGRKIIYKHRHKAEAELFSLLKSC